MSATSQERIIRLIIQDLTLFLCSLFNTDFSCDRF